MLTRPTYSGATGRPHVGLVRTNWRLPFHLAVPDPRIPALAPALPE